MTKLATMRDVAKLAGVSHGTVSNVLNGSSNVTLEKIKRVEDAIRQLGYKPNSMARILKNCKTNPNILFIAPNLSNSLYNSIYSMVRYAASERGIWVDLYLTDDMPYSERAQLTRAQTFGISGAIVITSQPGETELFSKLNREGFRLLFLLREVQGQDYIGFDYRALMLASIRQELAEGRRRIAIITGPREFSSEARCVDGYLSALLEANLQICNDYVVSADNTPESFMRATVGLMNLPEPPEVIYVTDDSCLPGVQQALKILHEDVRQWPRLVILSGQSWPGALPGERTLPLPGNQIGELAISHLVQAFDGELPSGRTNVTIPVRMPPAQNEYHSLAGQGKKIRVLLQSSAQTSPGLIAMVKDFTIKTGIEVEFIEKKYGEVLDTIENSNGEIDVFSTDLVWTPELNACGLVEPLGGYLAADGASTGDFQDNILREYCFYKGNLYAMPYSYTAQILLYRRDLFDSLKNKRQYYEIYKKELRVPQTWQEYNDVARFFTRAYNPESETRYGTTLGGNEYNGAACELLPRIWGMAGGSTDGDWLHPMSDRFREAFKNYVECFKYAQPDALDCWWNEEEQLFASGDAAMMVVFSEHIASLWDRGKNKIAGKIGHSTIPGEYSLLGGWSMAIHSKSRHKQEAYEFVKWSCSGEMAMPNAAMGRILPYKAIRESAELSRSYPWLGDAFNAFEHIGRRYLPSGKDAVNGQMRELERIIGRAVRMAVAGGQSVDDVLQITEKNIKNILK